MNGWCVTGTPITNSVNSDLHGLLVFLDNDPFADKAALRSVLLEPYMAREQAGLRRLTAFLASIMWRSEMADVVAAGELILPGVVHRNVQVSF